MKIRSYLNKHFKLYYVRLIWAFPKVQTHHAGECLSLPWCLSTVHLSYFGCIVDCSTVLCIARMHVVYVTSVGLIVNACHSFTDVATQSKNNWPVLLQLAYPSNNVYQRLLYWYLLKGRLQKALEFLKMANCPLPIALLQCTAALIVSKWNKQINIKLGEW